MEEDQTFIEKVRSYKIAEDEAVDKVVAMFRKDIEETAKITCGDCNSRQYSWYHILDRVVDALDPSYVYGTYLPEERYAEFPMRRVFQLFIKANEILVDEGFASTFLQEPGKYGLFLWEISW
jgi:hypothetical protein